MRIPRKIAVVVMSRANYGRLKSVIQAIENNEALELQLILGASFYDQQVPHKVKARIQCLISSDDHEGMALTASILGMKISETFARLAPDVVLIHGDRYEMLTVAMAAAYQNIPVAHTEGGEITGCIDDKVRNAITALADIHFPVTYISEERIQKMRPKGKHKDIHVVGSTALDTIVEVRDYKNEEWLNLNYIVCLYHPNTTEEESFEPLVNAIEKFRYFKGFNKPAVICINPNVDAGSMKILKTIHSLDWKFHKNLSPGTYAILIKHSKLLIGNSSSGIKEGAFLGMPYVCVGSRQKGREIYCNTLTCSMDETAILDLVASQYGKKYIPSNYFGDGTAGKQIADILAVMDL